MNDLLSLVLRLQALPAAQAAEPPQWWGRAAHALLLRALQAVDPKLAESLHEGDDLRPFTASSLLGWTLRRGLDPRTGYAVRFTACEARLTQALLQAAQSGPLAPGQTVELDGFLFQIRAVEPAADQPASPAAPETDAAAPQPAAGWAALHSYQALSAPYLLSRVEAPRRLTLQLASPTGFRSGGRQVPLPLPGLVFGSLLDKGNAFAPIAFPPEFRRYAEECLAITRFELRSHGIPAKGGGSRLGAVGTITYSSLNYDRYWMSVCAALADFALFAGVGAGVSQGLGQCRRLAEPAGQEPDPAVGGSLA